MERESNTTYCINKTMYMIKQIYLLAILPALMMTGCNDGDNDTPTIPVNTFPKDGSIQVTTTVNNLVINRATGGTDFAGSDFRLFIDPEEQQENGKDMNADYHYQLTVKKSAAGNWDVFEGTYGTSIPANPLADKIPLWAGPKVQTSVKAYANYKESFTPTSPLLDQSTVDKSNAVDLLYFYKSLLPGTELDGNKKLAIDFTHRLSQLNIILKFGSEFNRVGNRTMDAALIKSVGIYEMQYGYTFDVNKIPSANGASNYPVPSPTGSITNLSDLTIDPTSTPHITPYIYKGLEQGTNPTITYTALVVPQTVTGGSHLVVISLYPMKSDGKADTVGTPRNYVYTVPTSGSLTFESGIAYKLTLTVGKDQITDAVLTPEAWTTGSNDEIITD